MKKTVPLMITFLLTLSLLGCSGPVDELVYDIPQDGVWYCAELEVDIVFDRVDGTVKPSFAVIDGYKVKCICENEYNTPDLYLLCQQAGVSSYNVGEIIYWWTVIEYTDDTLVLENHETKELHYFERVEQ